MLKDNKNFSSFSVDDTAKAKTFYTDVLGLNVEDDPNMPGLLNVHLGGGAELMIYPKPDHQAATFTVLNFLVSDLEKAVDELTGKGVKFEQYDTEYVKTDAKGIASDDKGPNIAWFKDPAGNVLSLIEER